MNVVVAVFFFPFVCWWLNREQFVSATQPASKLSYVTNKLFYGAREESHDRTRKLREYPAQKENARRMTIPPATQAKTSS